MTPIGLESAKLSQSPSIKPQATNNVAEASSPTPLKVEQNTVTLSEEGKALLSALQEIEHNSKADKTVSDKVESFAHGALGMDHPDTIEEEDSSYSAGQYLSAAATVGGILLALI
ncbi:hypothetical protein DZ860_06050 [Vibrio sinensis]|uniref:Uncharacterized protein n=1 Tax=Vibrio sinensis TaxID=2302434 RepID=A0A3A6QXR9_9VIBR|nr:hypothetical protein [Vibrio sinensis]RJX73784.1 hypothetical protein DZ860_06050 [Vibrio sinensis]